MTQVRLPLYASHGQLSWTEAWILDQPDLFTALLLECGNAPTPDPIDPAIAETFGPVHQYLDHYSVVECALEKYYRASCPLPFRLICGHALDHFFEWVDSQKG